MLQKTKIGAKLQIISVVLLSLIIAEAILGVLKAPAWAQIFTGAISILFFLASIAIIRNLVTRIMRITDAVCLVSEGDLSAELKIYGNDELGDLGRSINRMLRVLHGLIVSVKDNTDQLACAAEQLHSTAVQMATGAEEVAAQTSTVAVASEEMSSTAHEIANNCIHAADSTKKVDESANTGRVIVEETIKMMGAISNQVRATSHTVAELGKRSDQIGEIVTTIEDIADQTNLLALNAAIEAARAGEQGRGFAVVADEVRALAERTTKATKEISDMIRGIQKDTHEVVESMEKGVSQARAGTMEAGKSREALKEILTQVETLNAQVGQIATAAEQQTATTNEISGNITQITEVVQETARGAQESADAASRLSRLVDELSNTLGKFTMTA
ncbi:MAG TPA: methyl-accepting chemotaxis protein [Geobacteraceae bacterium]|nr:methyl-accepting chemotaxis protein [Geobacteraceae bacterium]